MQEYILLTLPSTCTPLPLLSLFTLVRPLPASVLPHVLYVLHRDTLLAASHLRYTPTHPPLYQRHCDRKTGLFSLTVTRHAWPVACLCVCVCAG